MEEAYEDYDEDLENQRPNQETRASERVIIKEQVIETDEEAIEAIKKIVEKNQNIKI